MAGRERAGDSTAFPWPGLAAYTEQQAELFCGRGVEIASLAAQVERGPLTLVYGPSGVGKTSLLQAGVFPALRDKKMFPVRIHRLDFSPSARPLTELIDDILARECENWECTRTFTPEAPLNAARPETLWEYLHRLELWSDDLSLLCPVLVFDQFEDCFTVGRDHPRRDAMLREIACVAENAMPRVVADEVDSGAIELPFERDRLPFRTVIALREDFLGRLRELRDLMPGLLDCDVPVRPLNGKQALEVVEVPGRGLVTPEMAREIVRFVAGMANSEGRGGAAGVDTDADFENWVVEPALLSLVCSELEVRRREKVKRGEENNNTIELPREEQSRRVILRRFYEDCMSEVAGSSRRWLEEKLLDGAGYRNSLSEHDVIEAASGHDETELAVSPPDVKRLVDLHLLHRVERYGQAHYELCHDVLAPVMAESRAAFRREREQQESEKKLQEERRWRQAEEERRKRAEKLQAEAVRAREKAAGLIGFMLNEVAAKLDPREHLDLLIPIAREVEKFFDEVERGETTVRDPRVAVRAFECIGDVRARTGEDFDAAAAAYRKALDLLEDTTARRDGSRDRPVLAGRIAFSLGQVMDEGMGDSQGALEAYRESVRYLEGSRREWPADALELYDRVAQALIRALRRAGLADEAEAQIRSARAMVERVSEQMQSVRGAASGREVMPSARGMFAPHLLNVAVEARESSVQAGLDRPVFQEIEYGSEEDSPLEEEEAWSAESEEVYRQRLQVRREDAMKHSGDIWRECDLAEALTTLGLLIVRKPDAGDDEESEGLLLEAYGTFTEIERSGRQIPARYRAVHERTGYACADLLIDAAESGDLSALERILAAGLPVDMRNARQRTAMMCAAAEGQLEAMRRLLDAGADIKARNDKGGTALCWAAQEGRVATICELLDRGADIESASTEGWRSLMLAAQHGHVETGRLLLERGAQINARKNDGLTALSLAAWNGRTAYVTLLLDRGTELDVRSDNGLTPLMWACNDADGEHVETVSLLLDRGADIESVGTDGWRSLMIAAQHGHVKTGRLLLDRGATIDARKSNGSTALLIAVIHGQTEYAALLIDRGAELEVRGDDGYTPLMRACNDSGAEHVEMVSLLLDRGADIESASTEGLRVLALGDKCQNIVERFCATTSRKNAGETDAVALLVLSWGKRISAGSWSEAPGTKGRRSLMIAAQHGHVATGRLLLDRGATIDARNNDGLTALSLAAFNGRMEYVALLLDSGATAGNLDVDGNSAIIHASANGHDAIVARLFGLESFDLDVVRTISEGKGEPMRRRVEACIVLGDVAQRQEDTEQAIALFQRAHDLAMSQDWPARGLALCAGARLVNLLRIPIRVELERMAGIQQERIDLFREQDARDPERAVALGTALSVLAWHLVMLERNSEALPVAEESLSLASEVPNANLNAAHVFLLTGDTQRAIPHYRKAAEGNWYNGQPGTMAIRDDFRLMREAGIDHPEMKTVETLLELEAEE